jgi:NADPH-dependent 7-cyano-7-deazaguanine reductase QueF-like protein
MANPNIVNVTSILGKTFQAALNTTLTTELLANAAASGLVYKINNISVANIDGTNAADASILITKSGGSPVAIASTISVPADSTLVVTDKNTSFYLEEGDNIEGGASADNDLVVTISYEIISSS